jgi:hypothetical protein
MPDIARGALVLAALALVVLIALVTPPAVPPAVAPETVDPTVFSTARARLSLREITRRPRPVGSDAHLETRAYLVTALQELGLAPELQQATAIRRRQDTVLAAPVVNILARLPGLDPTRAVVLAAHYDSVPNAPGAGDAGNGLAAILETTRALLAGPPLRNDVIVLFTDAEEVGLLGARAYVDAHPWAADTGIVLNAEGRGHAGPVHMFRTTANNGRMIEVLARAAPHPAAESLANELFRLMPNDTDLSIFQEAGYAGMDFANVRSLTHYHTPLDNFENADPRTLQHHGSYLLPLARAFGDLDLSTLGAPDRIYFSLPAGGLVHYPLSWARPLAVLAALLAGGLVVVAARRGTLRGRGLGAGLLHLAGALIALPLLAIGAWRVLVPLVPEAAWFDHGSPYGSGRYLLGFGLLAAALYAGSLRWLRHRLAPPEILTGALVAWILLAVASAWWMPGASSLFLWPAVFAALGLAWRLARPRHEGGVEAIVLVLLGMPVLLFVPPLAHGIEEALTLDMLAAPIALLVLGLGLLALPLALVSRSLGGVFPAILAVAGTAALGTALQTGGFDAGRRKANSIHYIADLDGGTARWYSLDPEPDEWTRHFLGDEPERLAVPAWAAAQFPGADGAVWLQSAPVLDSQGPRAELLSEETAGEGRRLRLRISAPPGSYSTVVRFPEGPEITSLLIDGQEARSSPPWDSRLLQLVYFAMPGDGIELEIVTAGPGSLRLAMRANILGLPPMADGSAAPPRPDHMMPAGQLGDLTRLLRVQEFDDNHGASDYPVVRAPAFR